MIRLRKLAFLSLAIAAVPAFANEWPYWRGPEQNGSTRENAPVTKWSEDQIVWQLDDGGRTTPIVLNDRVYAITPIDADTPKSRERVICWEADTGKKIWEYRFPVFLTDIVENRVGWTSVVADPESGNIFAHGTGGELFCFDGKNGDIVWKHSLTEEYGRISGYGGRLMTPIVDENRVIVSFLSSGWGSHARPLHRYFAFDKETGDVLWIAAPGGKPLDTTYSCPIVAIINGKRMLIAPNADGNVYGMMARTGEQVWTFRFSKRGLNVSPVAHGNRVYLCQSEENIDTTEMGRVVCVDAGKTGDITNSGELWRIDGVTAGYSSPAVANDRLYFVTNNATMYCVDAFDGRIFWEHSIGRVGKGSPVVTADGVIYIGDQNGIFNILKDAGDKVDVLAMHEFTREDGLVDEMFGSPAVADGRLYFMTRYGTYCLGRKGGAKPAAIDIPKLREKMPSLTVDYMNVVPFEKTLPLGRGQWFRFALYDENRREMPGPFSRLRLNIPNEPVAVTGDIVKQQLLALKQTNQRFMSNWSSKGMTIMTDTGLCNTESMQTYGIDTVVAHLNERTATARVRAIPELPIEIGFDEFPVNSVPPGWVGVGGGKAKITELDGEPVFVKLAPKEKPSPPIMRMRAYATMPMTGGLETQVDVRGTAKKSRRKTYVPEMGMINMRYRCYLTEETDENNDLYRALRVDAWDPIPRFKELAKFDWQPDTWYTIKCEIKPLAEGMNTRCRAKVWPRGEAEPTEWMIDAVDPAGNREGAAGLYAYSNGTKPTSDGTLVYFDNFKVNYAAAESEAAAEEQQ